MVPALAVRIGEARSLALLEAEAQLDFRKLGPVRARRPRSMPCSLRARAHRRVWTLAKRARPERQSEDEDQHSHAGGLHTRARCGLCTNACEGAAQHAGACRTLP